eukprot:TRINITY_DN102235_c0_g1_i1.p1 TRINITY_DN102235_c0_g1~~TRINITY_DN102235_c0_g1_i1.p1  ORF type:complete len:484 (+),score=51.71 TRINITY_DN102235_c0_g1_i1:76-1527(+)
MGATRIFLALSLVWWRASSFTVSSPHILDSDRRVRIFHGTNFVGKGPDGGLPGGLWYAPELLNDSKIRQLKDWGFNTVRLGLMWAAAEPSQGIYNDTYFEVMRSIVDKVSAAGLWPILDIHQDAMSSAFNSYDGVPRWLVNMSVPDRPFPWPLHGDVEFPNNYLAEATGRAFQDLYDNKDGMRDAFAAFWAEAARRFKDAPILGYELINEPWMGDIYKKPWLTLAGQATKQNLQPMYDILSTAIRQHDTEHLILFEPAWGLTWTEAGAFDRIPGGDVYVNRSVYAYHYYCPFYQDEGGHNKSSRFVRFACDKALGPKVFETVRADVQKLRVAGFMTEFGECNPSTPTGWIECDTVLSLADRSLQSWTNWDLGWLHLQRNWDAPEPWLKAYSRTYARATAGTPLHMQFDAKNGDFSFCYQPDLSISQPTEIYANRKLHYPEGFYVQASEHLRAVIAEDGILHVTAQQPNIGCVNISNRAPALVI